MSVYGGIIRKNMNGEFKCNTKTWMRENFDGRVKEMFPLRNGNLLVKLEDDEANGENDKAKSSNTVPSRFGSFIPSHSKGLMNDDIKQIGGFYNNSIYYTDTDSLYIHKKYGFCLVDNGLSGKISWLG